MNNKEKKSKFEVGIIGAGAITVTLHLPLLSAMENTQPKYIVDVSKPVELAKIYKIDAYDSKNLEELPDCDIVLIATPVGVREQYINEFSKRGTPIFTEKPFATTIEEHKKFLGCSDSIACNYMKIWYNSSKLFENILTSQIFGNLKKISIKEGGIIGKTNRGNDTYQSDKKLSGGGIILESSCHTLSVLAEIFEDIRVSDSKILWEKELDVDAKVNFVIKENSRDIPIEYHATLIEPIETRTILFYDNSYIEFNHAVPNPKFIIHNYENKKSFEIKMDTEYANSAQQAYYLTWKNFIDNLKNSEKLNTEKLTSLKTTKLISDIYKMSEKK